MAIALKMLSLEHWLIMAEILIFSSFLTPKNKKQGPISELRLRNQKLFAQNFNFVCPRMQGVWTQQIQHRNFNHLVACLLTRLRELRELRQLATTQKQPSVPLFLFLRVWSLALTLRLDMGWQLEGTTTDWWKKKLHKKVFVANQKSDILSIFVCWGQGQKSGLMFGQSFDTCR